MSRWWFPNSAEGSFVSEWRVSKTWCVYCKMLYLLPNLTLESYFNQVQRMQHKSWRNSSRHASDKMLVANKPSDWRRFWSCWTVWNCLLLAHVVINWMCTFNSLLRARKPMFCHTITVVIISSASSAMLKKVFTRFPQTILTDES